MLQFEKDTHTYFLGDNTLKSVSSVVASQFKGFNSHAVASALAKKKESSYYGMNRDEILQQWSETGKQSRDAGINMHRHIEEYYQHGREPCEYKEWQMFRKFVEDHPDWKCVGTEVQVHNTKVAGTIDAIFQTPEGIVLVDWKRTKAIDFSGYGMGRGFMKHVADCNYSKYSLQLSLYRELYGGGVVECYVIQIHPNLDSYQKIKAQNFHVEACHLLS